MYRNVGIFLPLGAFFLPMGIFLKYVSQKLLGPTLKNRSPKHLSPKLGLLILFKFKILSQPFLRVKILQASFGEHFRKIWRYFHKRTKILPMFIVCSENMNNLFSKAWAQFVIGNSAIFVPNYLEPILRSRVTAPLQHC
jgi:hypothetical protein